MSLDAVLARLVLGALLLVLAEVVQRIHHARAARSRRSPVVLFGTQRGDDR